MERQLQFAPLSGGRHNIHLNNNDDYYILMRKKLGTVKKKKTPI